MRRLALLVALVAGAVLPPAAGAAIEATVTTPVAGAHSLSSVVPVTVDASATDGVQSVQLIVDGQAYGLPASTWYLGQPYTYEIDWDTSGLAAGDHTLSVIATDWTLATLSSDEITVDVGPAYPTVSLTTPQPYTFARGAITLASTVSGGQAPTNVVYSVDGNPLPSTQWDTTTVPDGGHTVAATVTDGRGKTATSSASLTVDNTPPSSYLTSPSAGSYASGTLAVSAHADDAYGVSSVQYEIDGTPAGAPLLLPDNAGGYTYSAKLDVSSLKGQHTLTEITTDNAGNTTTSTPVAFTIGGGPLQVSLTLPPDWTFAHGSVPVTVNANGGVGPYSVQLTVDGTASGAPSTAAPYGFSWDTTKVPDGSHTLSVVLTDANGQTATSAVVHQTVDNTSPATYLIAPAAGGHFSGTLAVSAHASDAHGIGNVQYKIDGSSAGAPLTAPDTAGGFTYSASLDISKLAPGQHTLAETATDNAGNTTTSAPVSFTVGAGQGAVAITAPVSWGYARKSLTVTATVTGGTAPFTGTLAVDGVATVLAPAVDGATLTFTLDTTKLIDGAHTLAVSAIDAAKLAATSSVVNVTVDNTAPAAVMYQPTPLAGYSYARTNGPTSFQVHASDSYGIKSVQFTVDGNPAGKLITAPDTKGGYLYTVTFDTSTLPAGIHSISALVTDNAGNTTTAAPLSLKSGPLVYVPVLNYHGIEGPLDSTPDIYDQTATEANAQLAYLKANGYQTITLPQYETWLQSGTLPAGVTKPVLITVDDGLSDELAWDPLLQRYGFKAVMYVATGFADNTTPGADDPAGNMSWTQIQSLAANGRWTIAFHAGQYGHGDYSDPAATIKLSSNQTQSYSTNCWTYYNCLGTIKTTTTTGSGRNQKTTTTSLAETPAQFEAQLAAEISAGIAELTQKVPSADLTSWACPWNACGQWTTFYNDPSGTIQSWFPSYVASKFQVVFMQTDPVAYGLAPGSVGPLSGDNRHYRFEVHTDTTISQFATALTDPAFANN